jgi:protein-L-isoaspartate(D-aspartate) O-methyltransferase
MKWLALLAVWTLPAVAGSEDPYVALRERMVREQAYEDHPLPIGHGQTISQPYIVAFMTQALDVSRAHRVLEIGTGSGYQAAVLSPLAGRIYTIEIVPALAAEAARKLERYGNVIVRQGDGYAGWPEAAPFDRIILTAAPPKIPETLIDQLKPGGKLLAPEGSSPWTQKLVLVEKLKDGRTRRKNLLPVIFVPMVRGP